MRLSWNCRGDVKRKEKRRKILVLVHFSGSRPEERNHSGTKDRSLKSPYQFGGVSIDINSLSKDGVLVQPEMEKRRSPLVSIPPFGRGFSRHGVFRSDGGWAAQERALTPPFILSMSPPGYPSAWLRPRSARFRFARQNHCNSATSCRFSTSGLPVTPPEPRPARPES